MTELGWLDTNVFIHALFRNDQNRARCLEILGLLRDGSAEGWIDPVVVHELTYVLTRLGQFRNRSALFEYVNSVLTLDAVRADDKETLLEALDLWAATDSLSFADARLTVLANKRGLPVCSANDRHFPGVVNSFRPPDGGAGLLPPR